MPSVDEVKAAIRAAFSEIEKPLGTVFLDFEDPFSGQRWEEVSRWTLGRESLVFFTPDGLRYYLPAYLLASLEGEYAGVILERLMECLCVQAQNTSLSWEWIAVHMNILSACQAQAIIKYLEYIEQTNPDYAEDARLAIDKYWSRAAAGNPITLSELIVRGVVVKDPVPPSTGSPPAVEGSAPTTSPRDEPEPCVRCESEPPEDFF